MHSAFRLGVLAALPSLLALGLVTAGHATDAGRPGAPTSGIDAPFVDPSVRVQDDFFRHVNGGWLAKTPIPADRPSTGAFLQIHETTQLQLRALIEQAAARADGPRTRQIGDLYASFLDEAAIEKLGAGPIEAEMKRIDAIDDRRALVAHFGRALQVGAGAPMSFEINQDARDSTRYRAYVNQSGLGLPDRDYYLKEDDARFRDVRTQYRGYIAKLLALVGETDTEAKARAILALETELARAQWTRVELRDPVKAYNPMDVKQLMALAPQIDWPGFVGAAGAAGKADVLVVGQPSYLKALSEQLASAPLPVWKAYAKLRYAGAMAPFLGRDFVDARFAFVGTVLSGTPENQPRWKRGVALVEESLGEGLGQLYVAKHFPPEHKARMEKLVGNLMRAYRQSLEQLDWMGPATKKEAQAKLATFVPKIGYPTKWIDYDALAIRRDDLVGNVERARRFEHARQVAKLGKPVDRDEWLMTPQTVNAYYNPSLNEIVFPAAILQPPFFDAAADEAVNYGGIGAVIGHEISHGFDDEGSQYDAQGNLRDWWTKEDRARFVAKTRRLVEQYGAFEPVPGYRLNGEQTLGENIADNSGLEAAWKGWQLSLGGKPAPVIDGLGGAQRFFYGFAQVWRGKAREAAMVQQVKAGVHSLPEYRVNGTVRNHPTFYTTFGVKPGDAMYLPPEQRVSIW
ncbi:M13 family metallopeptidase [Methylibium sp.]|uniref:M13 family metallopeptidase n=1 Tax=Methylibium sp. TaxID=2067992 RepID=UPI0039C94416